MKKLMVMIGAAVTALGLHASLSSSTSFEVPSEFNADGSLKNQAPWSYTDGATVQKTAYQTGEYFDYAAHDMTNLFPGVASDANYLKVKTTFGQPLTRTFTETSTADGAIFIDQLVQFPAFDEAPTTENADAKLLIYVRDMTADAKLLIYVRDMTEAAAPDTAAATNLYVTAANWNGDTKTTRTYNLGKIDVDGSVWHRLTVKAVKATDTDVGFQVFVDGVARAGDAAGYTDVSGLTTQAGELNLTKKIFPALTTGLALTAVAFDGQGALDDITETTSDIGAWTEEKNVFVAWDAGMSALTITPSGSDPIQLTGLTAAGSQPISYVKNMTIAVTPTFAQNYGFKEIQDNGTAQTYSESSGTYTISPVDADHTYTIVSKDTTPNIGITINGTPGTPVATFAEAVAAVNALTANDTAKLVINNSVTLAGDGDSYTEAVFKTKAALEIDLNGKTITGPAGCASCVIECEKGSLTISDSSGDNSGKIALNTDNTGAIYYGSSLTITGGTFDGSITTDLGAAANISDGKFKVKLEDAKLPRDKKWVDPVAPDVYYTIGNKPGATLTITKTGATATVKVGDTEITAASYTVYPDEEITVTDVAAATGWQNAEIFLNGEEWSEGETYTVENTDVGKTIALVVKAEPIRYSVGYYDADESEPKGPKHTTYFTITNYNTLTLWDGKRAGLVFNNDWRDSEGNTVGTDAELRALFNPENPESFWLEGTWSEEPSGGFKVIIGGKAKYFDTFEKAVAAATNGETIEIIADVELSCADVTKALTVSIAKDVTLTVTSSEELCNNLTIIGEGNLCVGDDGGEFTLNIEAATLDLSALEYAQTAGSKGKFIIMADGKVCFPKGVRFADATDPDTGAIYSAVETAQIVVAEGTYTKYADDWGKDGPVAKYGTSYFATLNGAVAAAINGATIEILADTTVVKPVSVEGNGVNTYAITIANDGHKVSFASMDGVGSYGMFVNGAKVTFNGNGTYEKLTGSGSMVQAGAGATNATSEIEVDAAEAAIVINGGTFIGADEAATSGSEGPSNLFTAKWGSITVNGGTFKNWRYDQARCVRGEGIANPVTVTINGGDFTVRADRVGLTDPATATSTDRLIPVDNKGGAANTTITIGDAAKFTCHADNAKYMSQFCGTGYKLKLNSEEPARYVRTAIKYATLAVVAADANVSDIVVTNALGETIVAGQFDIDDGVVATYKSATFAANYELDEENSTLTTGAMSAEQTYTITVASKSTGPEPTPIVPGVPQVVIAETAEEATNAVVVTATSPDKTIVSDEDYTAYFTAKAYATATPNVWNVVAELRDDIVKAEAETASVAAELSDIAAGTAASATIDNAKPGLWYSVKYTDNVGNIGSAAEGIRSQANADGEVTILMPKTAAGAAAQFYQIQVHTENKKPL